MKNNILFVCNGNIHRSVIAATSLKKVLKERKIGSNFFVDSCGLQGTKGTAMPKHIRLSGYPLEWAAARPTLQKIGIDISKHSFQNISAAAVKKADVILAMDDKVYSRAKNSLIKQFPDFKNKMHRFSELTSDHKSIEDPAGSNDQKFHKKIIEKIYTTLSKKYGVILKWIEPTKKTK